MFYDQSHLFRLEPLGTFLIALLMQLVAERLAAIDPAHQVIHCRMRMLRLREVSQCQLLLGIGANGESLHLRGVHACTSFPLF